MYWSEFFIPLSSSFRQDLKKCGRVAAPCAALSADDIQDPLRTPVAP
jgi:hypothetical protein